MEHGYFPINNDNISGIEMANFTLKLLQLTRNAIYSFIF